MVNSFSDNITEAGTVNGLMQYFPSTGISTLDFDFTQSASTLSLGDLQGIISAMAAVVMVSKAINVPAKAAAQFNVFATATIVNGCPCSGALPIPTNTGIAMQISLSNSVCSGPQLAGRRDSRIRPI